VLRSYDVDFVEKVPEIRPREIHRMSGIERPFVFMVAASQRSAMRWHDSISPSSSRQHRSEGVCNSQATLAVGVNSLRLLLSHPGNGEVLNGHQPGKSGTNGSGIVVFDFLQGQIWIEGVEGA
jgi:hypothetical protein